MVVRDLYLHDLTLSSDLLHHAPSYLDYGTQTLTSLCYDDTRGSNLLLCFFCAFSEPEVYYTCPAQSQGNKLPVGIQAYM